MRATDDAEKSVARIRELRSFTVNTPGSMLSLATRAAPEALNLARTGLAPGGKPAFRTCECGARHVYIEAK